MNNFCFCVCVSIFYEEFWFWFCCYGVLVLYLFLYVFPPFLLCGDRVLPNDKSRFSVSGTFPGPFGCNPVTLDGGVLGGCLLGRCVPGIVSIGFLGDLGYFPPILLLLRTFLVTELPFFIFSRNHYTIILIPT